MPESIIDALARSLAEQTPCVLATVVQVDGSAPRQTGAKMLIFQGGDALGTIGGGSLEAAVLKEAAEALRTGQSRLLSYNLKPDLGMLCGGRAKVFLEPHGACSRLYLFGAGHLGKALYPLAAELGFQITVLDERQHLATAERFPGCAAFIHSYDTANWEGLIFDQNTYCVVATKGHASDTVVVTALFDHHPRYVGMIGSKTKRRAVGRLLLERGVAEERLAELHTPMGLPIGAESPEEIAVSIAAELIQIRRGERMKKEKTE